MHAVSYQQDDYIRYSVFFLYDIQGFPICRSVERSLLSMVFQKETGALAHMTQEANWLRTVEKLFNLAFRLFKRSRISKVTGNELGVFATSKKDEYEFSLEPEKKKGE